MRMMERESRVDSGRWVRSFPFFRVMMLQMQRRDSTGLPIRLYKIAKIKNKKKIKEGVYMFA